jgi:nucleotide-binding universal stress UspA family protein
MNTLQPHSLIDPPASGRRESGGEPPTGKTARFGELVACLDGSELGNGVVSHAQLLANAFGSRLTLLRVLESDTAAATPEDPLDWRIRQREARADLEELAAKTVGLESAVRSELIQGRAAEQICQWAEQHDVGITVLCSHGARGLTDWDLASTARKLVEQLPRSFLLVPGEATRARQNPRYQRILVPLDGSVRAESVLPIAQRIATGEDAELLLLHVVPTPELIRAGPLEAEGAALERSVIERNHRVASDYLDRVRNRLRQSSARVSARVLRDRSVRARLDRFIREEAIDIVVMAAHGDSGRTDSACGSVTEHALTHATAPVLVIREDARRQMRRVGSPVGRPAPAHPSAHAPR